jgi:hypothetical protein
MSCARAFVKLREVLASHADLARKLEIVEESLANLDADTRRQFQEVYGAILALMGPYQMASRAPALVLRVFRDISNKPGVRVATDGRGVLLFDVAKCNIKHWPQRPTLTTTTHSRNMVPSWRQRK